MDIGELKHVPSGLNNFKSKVNKLEVNKSAAVPIDLKKLSDAVKIEVVNKLVYDELVKKVSAININGLVKETDYDNKITESEDKIPRVAGLGTAAALTAVKNKIPKVSDLVKRKQIMMQIY